MPNVASFENTPKSKKKKRKKKLKGKNLPAATPAHADDDGESTESDDPQPQPPVPPKTSKVSWSNEQVKYLMLNTYLQSPGAASAASAEIVKQLLG